MNLELEKFARAEIEEGLNKLEEKHRLLFKRMYSHDNLELSIHDVVAKIPSERLDWALTQVHNTLKKDVTVPGDNDE